MPQRTSYMGWKLDFTQPHGEPAYVAPDSVTWRIFKNPVTAAIGGACAVLLEFADPRIRTGVWEHSTFRTDPIGRAERTGYAAAIGAYGPASAARRVIHGITNMHAKVEGKTPGGEEYRALDPELLDWVGATAGFGFLTAYDRFASPLSKADKDRFFTEGVEVSKLYGVQNRPRSLEEFHNMMMKLAPGFEPHPINLEFLNILQTAETDQKIPKILRHYITCAAVDILPPLVRHRLELGREYQLSLTGRLTVKALARLVDAKPDIESPAAQSCERLGLPRDFLWKSQRKQKKLLAVLRAAEKTNPPACDSLENTS